MSYSISYFRNVAFYEALMGSLLGKGRLTWPFSAQCWRISTFSSLSTPPPAGSTHWSLAESRALRKWGMLIYLDPSLLKPLMLNIKIYSGWQCRIFMQLGFSMKLTHLGPVQYWFINSRSKVFIHKRDGRKPYWLKWLVIKKGNYSSNFIINQEI